MLKYFLILIFIILASCEFGSEYPGYSKSRDGFYYKLRKIGEGSVIANVGDYVTVDLAYRTMQDSLFFQGRRKFQLTEPSFRGSVDHCFLMLEAGDAASFIISANDFFTRTLETALPSFMNEEDLLIVDIDMIEIQKEQDFLREKEAFLYWVNDFGEYEKVLLTQFFQNEKLDAKQTESGLYLINLKEGLGKSVELGDTVEVHYEGRFLNGKFFDSTRMREEAFQFIYGQEWQVVEGLEEALGYMREGDISLVILPSKLAFGVEGSSTGIIPPFTSLIFEVEVKSVK
jgi:FKBP-type peptidyl-prolyl cis-trans isomerase FkpA